MNQFNFPIWLSVIAMQHLMPAIEQSPQKPFSIK